MFASKLPAYVVLTVAVAAGVLTSGANKRTSSGGAPVLDVASAPAPSAARSADVTRRPVASWEVQILTFGSLQFKSMLPWNGSNAKCTKPGLANDEVGVCQSRKTGDDEPFWQIRIVTQRDRFIPVSWFADALQSLRALQPDVLTRQLEIEANAVTKAGFNNVALSTPVQLPDSLAIQGSAVEVLPGSSGKVRSCVYAFLLSANRPTTLLYCAATEDEALLDAQKIVSSLSSLNPSREFRVGSAQAAERDD